MTDRSELRRRVVDALDPASIHLHARRARSALRIVVCLGLAATILRTTSLPAAGEAALRIAMLGVLLAMALEYAVRLALAPDHPDAARSAADARLGYAFSAAGIVDVIGFAPLAIALALPVPPETSNLLGVLWVVKLMRYSPNLAVLARVLRDARPALQSVMLLFACALLVAATAAHLIEGERQPEEFGNVARSLWWAVTTLTTTGYGDSVPVSTAGRLLAGVVMISGIAVFALWAGILANVFSEELRRRDFLTSWQLVARVPMLRNVGATTIAEVARLLRPHTFPSGTTLFRRGERGDCMYFIVSGEVDLLIDRGLVIVAAGDFFGEIALVQGGLRTGRAVTRTACTLLVLDIADFHRLASQHPELSSAIHAEASRRLQRSETET